MYTRVALPTCRLTINILNLKINKVYCHSRKIHQPSLGTVQSTVQMLFEPVVTAANKRQQTNFCLHCLQKSETASHQEDEDDSEETINIVDETDEPGIHSYNVALLLMMHGCHLLLDGL